MPLKAKKETLCSECRYHVVVEDLVKSKDIWCNHLCTATSVKRVVNMDSGLFVVEDTVFCRYRNNGRCEHYEGRSA